MSSSPGQFEVVDKALEDNVTCCICLDIWREPVSLSPCGHVLCQLCADNLEVCPQCRAVKEGHRPARVVRRITEELPVRCCRCDWQGPRNKSSHHDCIKTETKLEELQRLVAAAEHTVTAERVDKQLLAQQLLSLKQKHEALTTRHAALCEESTAKDTVLAALPSLRRCSSVGPRGSVDTLARMTVLGLSDSILAGFAQPLHHLLAALPRFAPHVRTVRLSCSGVNNDALAALCFGWPGLVALHLQGAAAHSMTSTGAEIVGRLPLLQRLALCDTDGITDSCLEGFLHTGEAGAPLPHLTALDLSGTAIGDETLRLVVPQLPALLSLAVASTHITDAGVVTVGLHPTLTELDLTATSVGVVGLAALGASPLLASLSVAACVGVDDFGISALVQGAPRLTSLNVCSCNLSGGIAAAVASHTALRHFGATATFLDDGAAATLSRSRSLETIALRSTRTTGVGDAALEREGFLVDPETGDFERVHQSRPHDSSDTPSRSQGWRALLPIWGDTAAEPLPVSAFTDRRLGEDLGGTPRDRTDEWVRVDFATS